MTTADDEVTTIASFPGAGGSTTTFAWLGDAVAGGDGMRHVAMSNASSPAEVDGGRWRARAAGRLADAVRDDGADRVLLVGHSMGGLSAVHLAGAVADRAGVPVRVLALNTPCPDRDGRIPTLSGATDAEVGAVLEGSGLGPEILGDPEMLAEIASAVRGDAAVADRLAAAVAAEAGPIPPMYVVATRDDAFIGPDRCRAWARRAGSEFAVEVIGGNHSLFDVPDETLRGILARVLSSVRRMRTCPVS